MSFIYVKITSAQCKVYTVVVDNFVLIWFWFTQILRTCTSYHRYLLLLCGQVNHLGWASLHG